MPMNTAGSSRYPTGVDGEKLRRRRVEAGLTSTQLGKLAQCSHTHICDIERGRREPAPRLLVLIAKALKVSPADLLFPEQPGGVQ